MSLPRAIVIGPQKAGTTWIHRYFENRGDVCLPHGIKETMFFDRHYDKGNEWYSSHFKACDSAMLAVEVAPTYFNHPQAPERILNSLGRILLVCTLRDPAERSFSLYLHMRRYGMTACTDFREAIAEHPEILESSDYIVYLERRISLFSQENLLVLLLEDLAFQPEHYARRLCDHLCLPYIEPDSRLNRKVNAAALPVSPVIASLGQKIADWLRSKKFYAPINLAKQIGLKSVFFGKSGNEVPRITKEERCWVVERLGPGIEKLEKLLGRDLSHWRQC